VGLISSRSERKALANVSVVSAETGNILHVSSAGGDHPHGDTTDRQSRTSTESSRKRKAVSYSVVTKILASWFVTVPVAGMLSALFLVMFQESVN
jgi:phosphate/sulfate permease